MITDAGEKMIFEGDPWQVMMHSCRKACKILNEEFKEPQYKNWSEGSVYHAALWAAVKGSNAKI